MFFLFYNFCLILLACIALPKVLYQYIFLKKYRNSFWQRFGFDFPSILKGKHKLVWIHAVSVGETKVVVGLAKLIKSQLPDAIILISSITETGHEEAKRSLPFANYHVFLPFDFSWIIKPLVSRAKPDLVIFSETDLWYNFLKSAKEGNASTILVNGKISERSFKRMKLVPFFSQRLLDLLDILLVQNDEYKQRFIALSVQANKIHTIGNLKLDEEVEKNSIDELNQWKNQLGMETGDWVIVLGSTHAPEEKMILTALEPLFQDYPKLKIILVPRHPERFNSVASIAGQFDPFYARLSQGIDQDKRRKIVLVDAMGVLKKTFQIADLAIIGGSFVPGIGGHNITEPSFYGVPVLFGPFMHNQPDLTELILESGGGEQVEIKALSATVRDLVENQEKRITLGLKGKKFLDRMHGATLATWELIKIN